MLKDKREFASLVELSGILQILEPFNPLWVGTIPIDVHIETSDIDIICFLKEGLFEVIKCKFGQEDGFRIKTSESKLVAGFSYMNVPFEIYAEKIEPQKQLGYLHMMAEANLIKIHGEDLRKKVRALKRNGMKTEPAFAKALGIDGDPYLELLKYNWPSSP